MTQRRLPATGVAATREAKPVPSTLMIAPTEKQLAGEDGCSLHVAFEELQCHLRQSRDEIARLSRLRVKLTAEVDAKNVSIGYLQQELEKRNRETQELRSKMDETSQDNTELRKRLAGSVGGEGTGESSAWPKDQKGFLYPIEIGSGSSDQENPPTWTLEDMSEHLMAQMQKEMTELKELGRKLSHSDGTEASSAGAEGADEEGGEEAALRLVSVMGAQLGAAKDKLLGQRAALLALLSSCRDDRSRRQSPADGKSRPALSGPRPSDESFRVYFTQQLSAGTGGGDPNSSPESEERTERVCPICEVLFPERVTQDDFEGHVLEHLSGHATVFDEQLSPSRN
ncbi:unnamed protein product [Ixodes hexagonus]